MAISVLLGVLVGLVLGLTGAGGGILAVPALVVGLGWPMQMAAPVALIAVAGSAALGALEAARKRLVRYKAALLMAVSGWPCTVAGMVCAHGLSQRSLQGLFAAAMLLLAARLWFKRGVDADHCGEPCSPMVCVDPCSGRFHWSWSSAAVLAAIGAATGFLTGLLGIGGGFVMVPLLRKFSNASMHGVVATSLMVIALVGGGGVVAALMRGLTLPWPATLWFALATATGMLLGRRWADRLAERQVQLGFAMLVTLVAMGMALKAIFLV